MRILILANNDVGLYKFRKELIQELLRNHKVFIALPMGNYINPLLDMGCDFIEVNIERRGKNPVSDFKLLCSYHKMMKLCRPDAVLTYTIKPNIYGGIICRINHLKYIANITGLGTAVETPGFIQKLLILLYRTALRQAACVFFQNQDNLDFMIRKGVVKERFQLLPGSGVNLAEYQLLEYPKKEIIEFVFVARIMKEKGIDQYLETAAAIKIKYPSTRFHICGFCEEEYEEILRNYEGSGHIVYHGLVNDMTQIYKTIHCIIHPTYYPEGMSNVLLEASASGRPVITTDRAGCREIVDDGVNGYLVKERSSEDIIKAVEAFLKLTYEEKKDMGLAGRKKVERMFDRSIVIRKYMQAL